MKKNEHEDNIDLIDIDFDDFRDQFRAGLAEGRHE